MTNRDHDLDTLERNLEEIKRADGEMEKQIAISNYHAAVNTLVDHSHRFASSEEAEDWMLEQKRDELKELFQEGE